MAYSAGTSATFGSGLMSDFLFDGNYLNLNHGSFGAYPRAIREIMRSFQDRAEAAPDAFIRYEYPRLLDQSRAALARLLKAPTDTIVLVPNATTAVNTVLRGLEYQPGDVIVYPSTIYGACEKTIEYLTETTPVRGAKVNFIYPVEDDWLVNEFIRVIKHEQAEGRRVRIALFDTVTSMPGCRVPFERLTRACKDLGVLSCIDGAHGVGHVPLDLGTLDPDFFTSNCHKWLFVPRGCAVFYVSRRSQHLLRSTLPTSHGFIPRPKPEKIINPLPPSEETPFVDNFRFVGTLDNSNYLCIPAAIEYRRALGGEEAITAYCSQLARDGAQLVAKALGTEVMENSTHSLGKCCLSNVRLPVSIEQASTFCSEKSRDEVGQLVRDWVSRRMVEEHKTFMALIFYGGHWWVRFSAQVYLEIANFEVAAKILDQLCARVRAGEFVPRLSPKL